MADCLPGGPVAEVAMAVLDACAHGGSGDRPMADPETGPWRIQRQAHGGLPCGARIGLSLGLQVVSAPVPSCSPRQAPL
jgi:hypothetical protein